MKGFLELMNRFGKESAESEEEIGINADILVDRRRGFYWCKVHSLLIFNNQLPLLL